jgi:hypothetical protein
VKPKIIPRILVAKNSENCTFFLALLTIKNIQLMYENGKMRPGGTILRMRGRVDKGE